MAVAASNLTTNGSSTDATSYNTASVSPAGDALLLLWVSTIAAATPNAPTVSGNGLTWVQEETITFGSRRITLFRAMGASPSTGALTIDFAGQTQTGAVWSLIQYTGIDTGGTNGSAAVVQSVADANTGTVSNFTVTLAAFASANNATAGGFGIPLNQAGLPDPGSGFTETGQRNQGSPNLATLTEFKSTNDTSVDADWTGFNVPVGAIAVEIAAEVVPGNISPAGIASAEAFGSHTVVREQPLMQTLTDKFPTGTIDPAKWVEADSPGTTVSAASNVLRFVTTTTAGYAEIDSATGYSLQDSYAKIEVVSVGNQSLTQLVIIPLFIYDSNDGDYAYFFLIANNSISWRKRIAGSDTIIGFTTFNSTNHRWLRIRESGGTIFFDRSADNATWTNITSVSAEFSIIDTIAAVIVGTDGAEGSGTTVDLDNFNSGADQAITPSGLSSAEAYGTAVITTGDVDVLPSGIASGEGFGTAVIGIGITAVGIASAEAFGTPDIESAPVTLFPTGIATAEAFGTPSLYTLAIPQTAWNPQASPEKTEWRPDTPILKTQWSPDTPVIRTPWRRQ